MIKYLEERVSRKQEKNRPDIMMTHPDIRFVSEVLSGQKNGVRWKKKRN